MNAVPSGEAMKPGRLMKAGKSAKPIKSTKPATAPHSLKERQRQEREQLILRAAEELLLERGYHEMAIDDIAERVGISKGTVYLHFAKKGDLVIALLDCGARDLVATLDETLASTASPREKLRMILERLYSRMSSKQFQVVSAALQNPALLGQMAEKRETFASLWDAPMKRIAAVIDEGKAAGAFDPTIPTPILLSLFRSLLTPHAYQRLVVQEGMAPDTVVDYLIRFFFKGIAPEVSEAGDPSPDAHGRATTNPRPH